MNNYYKGSRRKEYSTQKETKEG